MGSYFMNTPTDEEIINQLVGGPLPSLINKCLKTKRKYPSFTLVRGIYATSLEEAISQYRASSLAGIQKRLGHFSFMKARGDNGAYLFDGVKTPKDAMFFSEEEILKNL